MGIGAAASGYRELFARHSTYGGGGGGVRRAGRFSEFRQAVRRVRPSELLPELAVLALAAGEGPQALASLGPAPPWAIATAAREAVLWGNEYRREGVAADDLRRIFNAHSDIYEGDAAPEADGARGVHSLLTRTAYEQFPYQESIFEEVSRTHSLLVDGVVEVPTEVLTEQTWERILGAPIGQVVGATFLLQVAANENAGWFDPAWLDRQDLQPVYERWPRHVIERRADELSATFEDFEQDYQSHPHPPRGSERYAYNPLTARPFLRMPDGRLLAPQPRLVLPTVSPGALYYRGIRELGSGFARDLGHLTERYVGVQLSSVDDSVELHPEITYGKPERQSIDWFLVLPSVVVMFEVKSTRFGLLERAAVSGFEQRPVDLLNKALAQLNNTASALEAGLPEFAHIPRDRTRVGITVTAEPYYLANSHLMRRHLTQTPFPTITASLRDIEFLARLPLEEIERQLLDITQDPERSTWGLAHALNDGAAHSANTILQRAWDSYPWLEQFNASPSDAS